MSNMNKGILLLLSAAFGFAMMSTFVKLSGDLPAVQKTMFRNIVSAFIAFGFVLYHKERFFGKKENQKYLLLRSSLGTLGMVLYFYSIDHLVLSDADMLNKLSPFLLIIFSALFLNEKARKFQIVAIVIAFLGTLLIIKPEFSVETIPYMAGVSSAVFAALAYTVLRFLGDKEEYYTIVFYFSFFSTVVLLPFTALLYEPMSLQQTLYLLLAGVFATIGQFGITLAYKFAPAKEISIFFYTNILFSAVISIVVFNQVPDTLSFLGYAIIFGASFYMFWKNKKVGTA
ncbi:MULTISPECIES: DMT family transporter [Pontibacillus]|uniref:DMT family transporter n=1 Tax=Pontibacillus chungwhensis TaxID=265426 RepID=A0ABY8UUL9_9BACI|nr:MULTISPECIES: DMT family transporter [Pontibacillus]MCD5325117.1 DMT family transporter [Pontibacillus sp. HN14]WIF97367.1 DMT family transporter [Pontibacillus chungwhensis]